MIKEAFLMRAFILLFTITFIFSGCSTVATNTSKNKTGFEKAGSLALIGNDYDGNVPARAQQEAAYNVVKRLLGSKKAGNFIVEVAPAAVGADYFEVEARGEKIVLRGSNGVSACRGLKWYLNEKCNCSITWRGDNLNLPDSLPTDFPKHREATPYKYRYIFNNCIYGYSMPWWKWAEWERMLDVLAYNGVNMPALLLGQEKVWQAAYEELGYLPEDLENFFAGPAWLPWQWMGNLDGWGGPLPQSVIDGQCRLQQRILSRARLLGMKAVLPGFSGHIPKVLTERNPILMYYTMDWQGFDPTYILSWEDPMFKEISGLFIRKQREIYGTDHYYNIDPFNEMAPPRPDKEYLTNMARAIFTSIDEADPEGIWVLMTWFCKNPEPGDFWSAERTKNFFDAVPDERMLALELWGDIWKGTAWYRQGGWYNKPWVWNILQNFGNRVDIYGNLNNIFENYHKMRTSPDRGNIQGMGIMTEGLGYNPVVYELVLDMLWGDGVTDLEKWERDYLVKRYGEAPEPLVKAWDFLYRIRYSRDQLVSITPLCFQPKLIKNFHFDDELMTAWKLMLEAAPILKDSPTYQYDLVNISREVMGDFAPFYIIKLREAMERKDMEGLVEAGANLLEYIKDFDRLLGTNEHFLLGKWLAGARSWGGNKEEKALIEWGAKRQITDWGGRIGSYAIKEWSGYFTDRMLPAWELMLERMEGSLRSGNEFDEASYNKECAELLKKWPFHHSYLPTKPRGDAVSVSNEVWNKYSGDMIGYCNSLGFGDIRFYESIPGIAAHKTVTATGNEPGRNPGYAVNGRLDDDFWAAKAPGSLTVDFGKTYEAAAFHVFTYWKDVRYYKYTIDVSMDGENWTQVVDMSGNTNRSTINGYLHPLSDNIKCHYARINMLDNSANPSVHVVEFKVLSPEDFAELQKR